MSSSSRVAGFELGGTKSIVVIGRPGAIEKRAVVPTTSPDATLTALNRQLRAWHAEQPVDAIGIASFGPLRLDPAAPDVGTMLPTPKPGWSGAPVAKALLDGFDLPWRIDTDVSGAGLAEYRWGAGAGCSSLVYLTIGTGLGGGLIVDGRPVHGAMHPEIGHIRTRRVSGDSFEGVCPFHGDCIEGLVAGPALRARFGADPAAIAPDHPVWEQVAADLAELLATLLLTAAPERILIGGGVTSGRPFLLPLVHAKAAERLAGYLPYFDAHAAERMIVAPQLGHDAGPLGALALALAALES